VDIEKLVGQKLLFAFQGREAPSPGIITAFERYRPGGITLFRSLNMGSPQQIRSLTASLQRLARDLTCLPC
jgi:beta-N-acetylhexosaminidase